MSKLSQNLAAEETKTFSFIRWDIMI